MDSKQPYPSVLMLPWLAHGHISPYLDLAKKLSQRNFHIHLCSTLINLRPIRENFSDNHFSSIQFIEIHLPSSPELPPDFHTTKDLPPHLMSTLKTAFDAAKPAFCSILKTLKPDLVIYDFLQPWVPLAAEEENIKSVIFLTCGAATCSFLIHCYRNQDKEYPLPFLNFTKTESQKITQFMYYTSNGLTNMERFLGCIKGSSNFVLIKTSKEIEGTHIDYLSVLAGKEVLPVGNLVQNPVKKDGDEVMMEWLSKKSPSSTVFVSFGSEYFLSKEEIEEIAYGLELSEVSFIWVIRFHSGEKTRVLQEVLPDGFLRRVGDRGMVVEDWAPQVKILGHPSIGGFVSHCGWSSTLEGVNFGVPIIAMPMHLDQHLNAKLVAEIGIGREVKRENERFKRKEMAKVIKEVVVQEGKEVREKIRELSERMKAKGDEEVDLVVEKLVQLIGKS